MQRLEHRWLSRRIASVLLSGWVAGAIGLSLAPSTAGAQGRLEPVAIFGPDDRTPVPAQYQAVQDAIGVLFNIRSRSMCTAFCIGDAMIATAAHCLFQAGGDKVPRLAEFWFARNYDTVRDHSRIAGHATGATAQNIAAGSTTIRVTPPIGATGDWAMVRLAKPICAKHVLEVTPLPTADVVLAARSKRVFQVAYHRDYKLWRQAYSKPCLVEQALPSADAATVAKDFADAHLLLLHRCDTGGASSGSPLLIDSETGPKVVGINVGTYVQTSVLERLGQATATGKQDAIANTAVAASAFAGVLEVFRSQRPIGGSTALKDIQEQLTRRGHYAGPIDGTFGSDLRAAIQAYERAEKLPVIGIPTDALVKRLAASKPAKVN